MKGGSVRRRLSRVCFAAAAAALLAAVVPAGVGAQTPAAKPKIFSTTTQATGVDFYPDQQNGITPIAETFHIQFVGGLSSMSSSNGPTARSSVVDPGNGVTQGPAQACPVLSSSLSDNGFPFADQLQPFIDACVNTHWPYTTQADGFVPDNTTDVALQFGDPQGPVSGEGGTGHAIINPDGTSSTEAAMGANRVASLPGAASTSLFTSGSIQSATANFFDGSTAVSHAESRLNGVSIFGGLLTIDSITSIAEVRFAAGRDPVGASSTTVQGVKLLGQEASLDDQGVHPVGSGLEPLLKSMSDAGVAVKLIGATQGFDNKGFMTAQSSGVVVDITHPLQTGVNLPPPPPNPISPTAPTINGTYFVRYNLATVSTRAFARELTISGSLGGSIGRPSFAASAPVAGARPSGFTGGSVSAPAPPVTAPGDDVVPSVAAGFLGLDAGKVKLLYLAFTLATLGVCLVPKLALPARLPGASGA